MARGSAARVHRGAPGAWLLLVTPAALALGGTRPFTNVCCGLKPSEYCRFVECVRLYLLPAARSPVMLLGLLSIFTTEVHENIHIMLFSSSFLRGGFAHVLCFGNLHDFLPGMHLHMFM